ncbi:MAG: signal peptidase II [Bacilli bacterium]|nr:signal peptidase II [Bacilli bacterium]
MKNKIIYLMGALVLIIDQLTKMFIDKSRTIIEGFFYLNPVNNHGAAWSMFDNQTIFLISVSLVILVILFRYQVFFKMNIRNKIAFGLVYGGLLGNLLDRVMFGYVRDFLDFTIFGYNYPIFNLADTCLVIGVILLIVAIFKGEDNLEKNKSKRK